MNPAHDAFDRAWKSAEDDVRRCIAGRVDGSEDRADVLIETRLKAWLGFSLYDPANPFRNWAVAIARHACVDHHRGRTLQTVNAMPDENGQTVLDEAPDERPGPLEALIANEISTEMQAALDVLTVDQRRALTLYAQGTTQEQIGVVMGRKTESVRLLLDSARRYAALGLTPQNHETLPDSCSHPPSRRRRCYRCSADFAR